MIKCTLARIDSFHFCASWLCIISVQSSVESDAYTSPSTLQQVWRGSKAWQWRRRTTLCSLRSMALVGQYSVDNREVHHCTILERMRQLASWTWVRTGPAWPPLLAVALPCAREACSRSRLFLLLAAWALPPSYAAIASLARVDAPLALPVASISAGSPQACALTPLVLPGATLPPPRQEVPVSATTARRLLPVPHRHLAHCWRQLQPSFSSSFSSSLQGPVLGGSWRRRLLPGLRWRCCFRQAEPRVGLVVHLHHLSHLRQRTPWLAVHLRHHFSTDRSRHRLVGLYLIDCLPDHPHPHPIRPHLPLQLYCELAVNSWQTSHESNRCRDYHREILLWLRLNHPFTMMACSYLLDQSHHLPQTHLRPYRRLTHHYC